MLPLKNLARKGLRLIFVIDGWGVSWEIAFKWMLLSIRYWWKVSIGSGNGLVLSGNKSI